MKTGMRHALYLMGRLKRMKTRELLCDFTITVGVMSFPVHRTVLAACSDYFQAMFTSGMKDVRDGRVTMKDMEGGAMEICVQYMYSGEADLQDHNVAAVLHAADIMQLDELKLSCARYMADSLSPQNCLRVRNLAKTYCLVDTEFLAEQYTVENLPAVMVTEHFRSLVYEDVIYILGKSNASHSMLWEAAISWIILDPQARTKSFVNLLKFIKIEEFPFDFLTVEALWDPIVTDSLKYTEVLVSTIFFVMESEDISKENIFDLFILAKDYGYCRQSDTLPKLLHFIAYNFGNISKREEFIYLEEDDMLYLLGSNRVTVSHEVKWEAALHWARGNQQNYEDPLANLVRLIDIRRFPLGYMKEHVLSEILVKRSLQCKDEIIAILLDKLEECSEEDLALKHQINLLFRRNLLYRNYFKKLTG